MLVSNLVLLVFSVSSRAELEIFNKYQKMKYLHGRNKISTLKLYEPSLNQVLKKKKKKKRGKTGNIVSYQLGALSLSLSLAHDLNWPCMQ